MHHLVLHVLDGVAADQIRERRLDVRRSPYRKPHMTLGPAWQDDYLTEGRTLLVPLLVEGTELVGFWMVSFERRSQVGASHMALIDALADELARAIVADRTPFAGDHARTNSGLAALAEALPFGVFVGTLWGELQYANGPLVRACMERGIDLAATEDMVALLSELTRRRFADIRDELRTLVQAREITLNADRDDVVVSCQRESDGAPWIVVGRLVPRRFARGSTDQAFEVVTLAPMPVDDEPPRRITRPLYTLAG